MTARRRTGPAPSTSGPVAPTTDDLHYSDSSHRWIAPPGVNQEAWEAAVRAHQQAHQEEPETGPPTPHSLRVGPQFEYFAQVFGRQSDKIE